MNIYFEQNLLDKNFEKRSKKNKSNNVIRTALLAVGFLILLSTTLTMGLKDGAPAIVIALIALSVPFFLAYAFMGMYAKKHSVEYDYIISDTRLTVSAVYFRTNRKLLYTIDSPQIISVGMYGSDAYARIENVADKKDFAIVNYDDEKAIAYIYYHDMKKNKKVILFIEPNKEFMIMLRRAVSRFEVFDPALSELKYSDCEDGYSVGSGKTAQEKSKDDKAPEEEDKENSEEENAAEKSEEKSE